MGIQCIEVCARHGLQLAAGWGLKIRTKSQRREKKKRLEGKGGDWRGRTSEVRNSILPVLSRHPEQAPH